MKKIIVNGLIKYGLLIAMLALTVGQPAKAQSLQNGLRINIPFDFTVGDKKFPAGRYSVDRALPVSGDEVLRISSLEGKEHTFRSTIPVTAVKAKNRSTLVFHRYGDQYYLFQVWPAGALTGRVLPASRAERELQNQGRDMVGMAKTEVVNIVADLP